MRFFTAFFVSCLFLFIFAGAVLADDFRSSNFIVRDPVITVEGGYSSSASFQFFSSSGQTVNGETTATAFSSNLGFLYFPVTDASVVTATAGDTQVSLSWTATTGQLGLSPGAYEVGTATVSGGPYTFQNVGAVLTSNRTGLTNSTLYYFIVRALDTFGDSIATSTEVSATPVAATVTPAGPGVGGGGSGPDQEQPQPSKAATVAFTGKGYPNQPVTLLQNSNKITTVTADAQGNFSITAQGLTAGRYIFSLFAEDTNGTISNFVIYPLRLQENSNTSLFNIIIPPTLRADKKEVTQNGVITLSGQSAPDATVTLTFTDADKKTSTVSTRSGQNGIFSVQHQASFPLGVTNAKAKTTFNGFGSIFSRVFSFKIGTQDVPYVPEARCGSVADLNNDCRVDLVDFSILIYWFDKTNPPARIDLNEDTAVDIFDFSIMAYYWTG